MQLLLQLGSSIVMDRIISVRHAGLDKVRTSCCRLQAGLKKIIFSDSVRVLVEAIHFDSINKYGFNTVHYYSVAVLIVLLHCALFCYSCGNLTCSMQLWLHLQARYLHILTHAHLYFLCASFKNYCIFWWLAHVQICVSENKI